MRKTCSILWIVVLTMSFLFLANEVAFANSDTAVGESSNDIYEPLVNEYQRVFSGNTLNTNIMKQNQTGLVNCHCGTCNMRNGKLTGINDCSMNLKYSIFDINQDGTDEIIFADFVFSDGSDEPEIYSIWTNNGTRPVFLKVSEYRDHVSITRNGVIKEACSGGWQTATFSFYEISGTRLVKVAGASYDYGEYYPNDSFDPPESRQEYNEIMNMYDTGVISGLTWTEIKSVTPKASKYPIKTFKVGSKSYTKKFKKYGTKNYGCVTDKKKAIKNKKLTIKTGEGWKIKGIYAEWPVGQGVSSKKLKNNKKFSVPKKHYIWVELKNEYTGKTIERALASY